MQEKKEIWMVQTKRADFQGLAAKLGVSPVTVRIMRNRGLETEEAMRRYLYGKPDELHDPSLMLDMEKAVAVLLRKLRAGKPIRIIGDYDIDGVCSTYLLLVGLKRAAAALIPDAADRGRIDYEIPDRIRDGYGINEAIVLAAAADGVDTIITCDNGIAAARELEIAKERGMTVIVTDHHEVPLAKQTETAASDPISGEPRSGENGQPAENRPFSEHNQFSENRPPSENDRSAGNGPSAENCPSPENDPPDTPPQVLPPADAVVDPKRAGDPYPFPEICGAVVVYKLLKRLYEEAGVPKEEWEELLEFAAIATVGDVMKLQDENRILVRYGLRKLEQTNNIGLRALIRHTGLEGKRLTAYHIGFVIGPCLNAGGRLQTAKLALRLFQAETEAEADALAEELKELNDQRKDMTKQGEDEAARQVLSLYPEDKVLVLFLPDCHESLAGIIAGRVRERFHKPALVLTRGETTAKGSGRSIEAYHMFRALTEVSDLLPKFGGHPMAAGLSIAEKDIGEFRRRLNENARLTEDDFIPRVWIDVPMPFEYVSEALIHELSALEPFGQGNEKPLFAQKGLRIRDARVLGKNRNVVKLTLLTESGLAFPGLWFGDGDAFMQERGGKNLMDIIYYPEVNEYNGSRTLQAVIKNYALHERS